MELEGGGKADKNQLTMGGCLLPDTTIDWSDFPSYLGSPPSSPFHGFGKEELPGRLIIKTEQIDVEDVFESISREKKRGIPKD